MTEILTSGPIRSFENGRTLRQTLASGTVTDGVGRDGSERTLTYAAGSVVLASPTGALLAGPLDLDGAEALAAAVIEGDARVLTSPGVELRLASALLVLICEARWEAHELTVAESSLLRQLAVRWPDQPDVQARMSEARHVEA